jgi:hypothetical protein
MGAYGSKARPGRREGRRLHPPARRSLPHGVDGQGGQERRRPRRPRARRGDRLRGRAAYVTANGSPEAPAHAREQCRWFGGMVGDHVADLVGRYGETSPAVPAELTGYIRARQGYDDYAHHGRSGDRARSTNGAGPGERARGPGVRTTRGPGERPPGRNQSTARGRDQSTARGRVPRRHPAPRGLRKALPTGTTAGTRRSASRPPYPGHSREWRTARPSWRCPCSRR